MADDQNNNPQLPLGGDGQGPGAANIQPINIEVEALARRERSGSRAPKS